MDKKLVLAGIVLITCLVISIVLLVPAGSFPFSEGCVAVIRIDGEIATSSSGAGIFGGGAVGSDDITKLVKDAEKNDDVKAIVFEINSPGGSVVGSREIYDGIKEAKKPKVAYFRELAASGGYYVSMGTDYIVSNPDAITGSIGVISTHQALAGLFEKLGINETAITTGPHKDMGSPARELTAEEKQIIRDIINEMYDEFKDVVRESRGSRLDMSQFDTMTDGRIVTGRQALKAGLVDELGNKQDALNYAANLAGMEGEPEVCQLEIEKGFFETLFEGLGGGIGKALSSAEGIRSGWKFGYR